MGSKKIVFSVGMFTFGVLTTIGIAEFVHRKSVLLPSEIEISARSFFLEDVLQVRESFKFLKASCKSVEPRTTEMRAGIDFVVRCSLDDVETGKVYAFWYQFSRHGALIISEKWQEAEVPSYSSED